MNNNVDMTEGNAVRHIIMFAIPLLIGNYTAAGVWGIWWSVGVVWFMSGFTAWLRYLKYWKYTKNLIY